MQIREIAIDNIEFGVRLRKVDTDHVQMLARSIEDQGQRTPIDVRSQPDGRFRLIAGAHRIEACRAARLSTVLGVVHDVDEVTAQLIEVDENLMRHELTALDRAAFLARRKQLYLAKFPETGRGGKRVKGQTETNFVLPLSFSKDAAKRLDLSPRSVELSVSFHQRLTPEVRDRLSGTRLADNVRLLIDLSRLDRAEQLPVVKEMLSPTKPAKSVAQAVARLFGREKPEVSPDDARYRRIVADWSTGSLELREKVLTFLRREGYKITAKPGA